MVNQHLLLVSLMAAPGALTLGCGSSISDGGGGATSTTTGVSVDATTGDTTTASSGMTTATSASTGSSTTVPCDTDADCAGVLEFGNPTTCIHADAQCGDGEKGACKACACGGEGCNEGGYICRCNGQVAPTPDFCGNFEYSEDATRCSESTFPCGDTACQRYGEICTLSAAGGACRPALGFCTYGFASCDCAQYAGACTEAALGEVTVTCDCVPDGDVCGMDGTCNADGTCRPDVGAACSACGTAGTCTPQAVCDPTANACGGGDFCWQDTCVRIASIAAGDRHACALTTGGGVQCWGRGFGGVLGNGQLAPTTLPVPVRGLGSGVASISAGPGGTCAVTDQGSVFCWPVGPFTQASAPEEIAGLPPAAAVAIGMDHACALTLDGTVMCWGSNLYGELGDGTQVDSDVPVDVVGLSDVASIALAHGGSCALKTDGSVWCWGGNSSVQLSDGTIVSSIEPVEVAGLDAAATSISAGGAYTCAVLTSGEIVCWGYNDEGQLGNGSQSFANTPQRVIGFASGGAAVSARGSSTCAVTTSGGIKCWGANYSGQLGDGSEIDSLVPVSVAGLASGMVAVAASERFACGLSAAGRISCWGHGLPMGGLLPAALPEP